MNDVPTTVNMEGQINQLPYSSFLSFPNQNRKSNQRNFKQYLLPPQLLTFFSFPYFLIKLGELLKTKEEGKLGHFSSHGPFHSLSKSIGLMVKLRNVKCSHPKKGMIIKQKEVILTPICPKL